MSPAVQLSLVFPERGARWRDRERRWVAPGATFHAPSYAVDGADENAAARFVRAHHYAGTMPAVRLCVGLYGPRARLVGVAVFSQPTNQRVVPSHAGVAAERGAELGRFVCAPDVAYNGESWFLARALRLLAAEKPELRAIVSYADPLARTTLDGAVVKPAHWGVIYQASNAVHTGRSSPRTLLVGPRGDVVNGRTLSKVRLAERGWRYAARQLVDAGAAPRESGQTLAQWVSDPGTFARFRRVRHPGNLAYAFALDSATLRTVRAHVGGGLPYPRPSDPQRRRSA